MTNMKLIHYHIFKNAGSSIDRLLQESFGAQWSVFEGRNVLDIVTSTRLGEFLRCRPDIIAVSSHMARPPLPINDSRAIVMLRHPLARAYSVYSFVKRNADQWGHNVAARSGFRDYVTWCLDHKTEGGVVIRDYQVIHLSEASHRCNTILEATAQPRDLDQAKGYLEEFGVFGIVNRFAESCRLFCAVYGKVFPQLRMRDVRENVTIDDVMDEAAALERIRTELGEDLFRRLSEENELDIQLYEWAKRAFIRSISRLSSATGNSDKSVQTASGERSRFGR